LITNIVEYAENLYSTKKIIYRMTINGSVLTNIMIDFMVKYNFLITISLDGSEEIQNRHRKFYETGSGTFHAVYNNIKKIKDRYETYFLNNVTFMPVVFDDENYQEMLNFYSNNLGVYENKIIPLDADLSGIDYTASEVNSKSITDDEKNDGINKKAEEGLKKVYSDKSKIPLKWHHNGQCIPSIKSIFIDVNGVLYPCEKVIENENLSIGHIENGLNMKKIIDFMNIGRLSEEECKSCWAMRFCEICMIHCNDIEKNKITSEQKYITCDKQKYKTLSFFKRYIKNNS